MEHNEQTIINKTSQANSFEFRYLDSAGTQVKIYYETPEELKEHLESLNKVSPDILKEILEIKKTMASLKEKK